MTLNEIALEVDCLSLDEVIKLRDYCQSIIYILEPDSEDEE